MDIYIYKYIEREREREYERFCSVRLFVTEFDCPDVTLCGWQDVKIQLLTSLLLRTSSSQQHLLSVTDLGSL